MITSRRKFFATLAAIPAALALKPFAVPEFPVPSEEKHLDHLRQEDIGALGVRHDAMHRVEICDDTGMPVCVAYIPVVSDRAVSCWFEHPESINVRFMAEDADI